MIKNFKFQIIFLLLLITYHLSLITSPVYAHGAGLPSFFKINGELAPANPLITIGVTPLNINVPQDLGPSKLVVNAPINFEIDTELLSGAIPPDILDKTKYYWDFGDGKTASGLKNTHAYSKIGSIILSVTAQYGDPSIPPQLIESVQLDIVPTKDYQTPKAVIWINGQPSLDPTQRTMDFDLNQKLDFDAGSSTASSSKIVQYLWDFGDGKTSSQAKLTHRYKLPQYYISPVLRIRDANGFTSDNFVNLKNSGKNDPNDPETENRQKTVLTVLGIVAGFLILFGGSYLLVRAKPKKP